MAHLVIYEGGNLAPSVTEKVGIGKGISNRPDDVMLVSTLLNWGYSGGLRLPRGATRVVVAGSKFTPEMKLFLIDAQSILCSSKATGIASPLPLHSAQTKLLDYIVFQLFKFAGDENNVIDALTTVPYLHHLRSHIRGSALPENGGGTETVQGGIPGSEKAAGSGPETGFHLPDYGHHDPTL